MQFKFLNVQASVIGLVLACSAGWVAAQVRPGPTPTPPVPAAAAGATMPVAVIVNGTQISQAAVDNAVRNLVAQGATDSPTLRDQVLQEIVAREVVLGEGLRLSLDKTMAFQQRLDELARGLLMDLVWADYLVKTPITEAEERADYARQKQALGGGDTTPQYLLSHIVLPDETQAIGALVRARKGESFAMLASTLSIDDNSKSKGGQIGWMLPREVLPEVASQLVGLVKGGLVASPIRTPAGWQVVRVDDVRPFKIPTFDESRPQLKAAVQNTRRQRMMEELMKKADIKLP